jgi:serine/threonine protein kinase
MPAMGALMAVLVTGYYGNSRVSSHGEAPELLVRCAGGRVRMVGSYHSFEILEKIGAGGMSSVYKGVHSTLEYSVAIKILHPALAANESYISRFEDEARNTSALRSRNIVNVLDFGSQNDTYFIVMEYVDGRDLRAVRTALHEGRDRPLPFPVEIVFLILDEIACGLGRAHERGIIHRDIKPSNIMLDREGVVKIADFGLARDMNITSRGLTLPGMVLGTPAYMSPEQAAGQQNLDARTDIFSLGVMAYEFLVGEKPFTGKTVSEIQERIIKDHHPPLTIERCPLLTGTIVTFLDRMLAKPREKRYQDMRLVRRAIMDCLESIDARGEALKHRQDILERFAVDPVAFAENWHHRNVGKYLKHGYHLRSQGQGKLEDSILAFLRVSALDPGNEKAKLALEEISAEHELPAEAISGSGTRPLPAAANSDVTEPAGVKTGSNGMALILRSVLAILVVGAMALGGWLLFGRGGGVDSGTRQAGLIGGSDSTAAVERARLHENNAEEGGTSPVSVATDSLENPTDTSPAEPENDGTAMPVEIPVQVPTTTTRPTTLAPAPASRTEPAEIRRPEPPPDGYLALDLVRETKVMLDGRERFHGTGTAVLALGPTTPHRLVLEDLERSCRVERTNLIVSPTDTTRLIPTPECPCGRLRLVASEVVDLQLDGRELARDVRRLDGRVLGAGEHILAVHRTGARVSETYIFTGTGERVDLPRIPAAEGWSAFKLTIPEGEEVRVRINLVRSS